ncbi:MAG: hypothetical protein AAF404_18220, partial [Pseudomonadota bacterium]
DQNHAARVMTTRFFQDSDGIVCIECENADLSPGEYGYWNVIDDATVSAGQYLDPFGNSWDRDQSAVMHLHIHIDTPGQFQLITRLQTQGQLGRFFVDVNGDYTAIASYERGYLFFTETDFIWQKSNSQKDFNLAAGDHTITIRSLNSHVFFDKVAIVPVGSTVLLASDTGLGPAETGAQPEPAPKITTPPPINPTNAPNVDNTFSQWIQNPLNDQRRVVLVEIDHAGGTIYLASKQILNNELQCYAPTLLSSPIIDHVLGEVLTLGTIEAGNPNLGEDWLNYDFHGFETRWYIGDEDWEKSQYRLMATGTVDDCLLVGDRRYRFDITSNMDLYAQTFHVGADEIKSLTLQETFEYLFAAIPFSGAYTFLNVSDAELATPLLFTVTQSTRMDELIEKAAASIGAEVRFTQHNVLEILKIDHSIYSDLTNDNVARHSVKKIDTIHRARRVKVIYDDGNSSKTHTNDISTGVFDEEVEIETLLANESDAIVLAKWYGKRYQNKRQVFEMMVFGLTSLMRVGDVTNIHTNDLRAPGVIRRIQRRALMHYSNIEVIA